MTTAPAKSLASGDSHYVVPMVLLCVLCLAAAFSAVLYAIAARADIDALSGRLSSLESQRCACPAVSSSQPIKKTDDNSPRLPENIAEERWTSESQEHNNGKLLGKGSPESRNNPTVQNQHSPSAIWLAFLSPRVEHLNPERESFHSLPAVPLNIPNEWEKNVDGDQSSELRKLAIKNKEKNIFPPHVLNGSPSSSRFKRSPLNQDFETPELVNAEVDAGISRQDRRRGSRRRGGAREDPGIRGGNRITGSMQTLALHFDGNTSKYSLGHRHFEGNGLLRHPDGIFRDWKMKEWGSHLSRQHRLQENEGTLTIRESGIYFVYAQVYYYDNHDVNGFQVIVNESPVLQCTTMTHGAGHRKANTCFTGGMVELHTGDTLLLKDIEALRYSIFQPEKSFFGLFRVAHHSAGQREGP